MRIIQAKCWSKDKIIREKHIFQLFGTVQLYLMAKSRAGFFTPNVSAYFITTTSLSSVAREAAEWLKIEVQEKKALSKTFPMIKCNVNQPQKSESTICLLISNMTEPKFLPLWAKNMSPLQSKRKS